MRDETAATLLMGMAALGLDGSGYLRHASHEGEADDSVILPRFWALAMADTQDSALPARVGLASPFGSFGLLDYLAASSPTLEAALEAISRHIFAVTDVASYRFEAPYMEVLHRSGTAPQVLFMSAVMLSRSRAVVGAETVRRIELSAGDPALLAEVLGVEVVVGGAVSRLCFYEDALTSPLRESNPGLHRVLLQVGATLGLDQPVDSLSARIRARLPGLFRGRRPTGDEIARSLGYSRRALSRLLAAEGCTLRELLDHWALSQATVRLKAGETILHVAEELGYSDQASFTRAFQRWTGQTPGVWSREHTRRGAR